MVNKRNVLFLLPIFLFLFACNDDDEVIEEIVIDNTLTWTLQSNEFSVAQESIEAKMTFTADAHVNHLAIIGTTETGEKLTIFVQELFPGGDGSCLSIERYKSEVIDEDCHDDGFLVICDHGGCEYENNEAIKFKSLDEPGGFVDITSCNDETKSISGTFELMLEENNSTKEPILIIGSFTDLIYEVN